MPHISVRATMFLAAAALLPSLSPALAGDLDPPVGPVAPTMKSLNLVEPRIPIGPDTTPGDADSTFRIAQSGSYYLTENVIGEAAKHGIELAAHDITLDLMGFAVQGAPGSLSGIKVTLTDAQSIVLRNGTVSGWAVDGIDTAIARESVIERIAASGNTSAGIRTGERAEVSHCRADGNNFGFVLGRYTRADTLYATRNQIVGISASLSCRLTHCTSSDNFGGGFMLGSESSMDNCDVLDNGTHGIIAQASTIEHCTVRDHQGDGIQLVNDCSVRHCTVSGSLNDGISGASRCIIEDNFVWGNDASGVKITGIDGSLARNRIVQNDVGIEATSGRYFISDNIVEANSDNYQISNGHQPTLLLSQLPEFIDFDCTIELRRSLTATGSQPFAIAIVDASVDIDLKGFELVGNATFNNAISIAGENTECTIRNGELRNWPSAGGAAIHVLSCDRLIVENVRVSSCNRGLLTASKINHVQIHNCEFKDNINGMNSEGLVSVQRCRFFNHGTALKISTLGAIVRENVFVGNGIALDLTNQGAAHIEDNSFFQNSLAIQFDNTNNEISTAIRNSFRSNTALFMFEAGDMIGTLITAPTIPAGVHPHGNYLIP